MTSAAGCSALTTAATPEHMPPPLIGTMTASSCPACAARQARCSQSGCLPLYWHAPRMTPSIRHTQEGPMAATK
jgi:hypothetical protein